MILEHPVHAKWSLWRRISTCSQQFLIILGKFLQLTVCFIVHNFTFSSMVIILGRKIYIFSTLKNNADIMSSSRIVENYLIEFVRLFVCSPESSSWNGVAVKSTQRTKFTQAEIAHIGLYLFFRFADFSVHLFIFSYSSVEWNIEPDMNFSFC